MATIGPSGQNANTSPDTEEWVSRDVTERDALIAYLRGLLAEKDAKIKQMEQNQDLEQTFSAEKAAMQMEFDGALSSCNREIESLHNEIAQLRTRVQLYSMFEQENSELRERVRQLASDLRVASQSASDVVAQSQSEIIATRNALSDEYRRRIHKLEEDMRRGITQLLPKEAADALHAAEVYRQQLADQDRNVERVISELRVVLQDRANATRTASLAEAQSQAHAATAVQLRKQLQTVRAQNKELEQEVQSMRATVVAARNLETMYTQTRERAEQLEQQLAEATAQIEFWKAHSALPGHRRSAVSPNSRSSSLTGAARGSLTDVAPSQTPMLLRSEQQSIDSSIACQADAISSGIMARLVRKRDSVYLCGPQPRLSVRRSQSQGPVPVPYAHVRASRCNEQSSSAKEHLVWPDSSVSGSHCPPETQHVSARATAPCEVPH